MREIFVQVRNEADESKWIGVYLDVAPPDGTSDGLTNPHGCQPAGRILQTSVFLDSGKQANVFADTGAISDGFVEFSCSDHVGATGKTYTLVAVADNDADDLSACQPGTLQLATCLDALANDDADPIDNQAVRNAPKVQPQ